ncbi:MAG: DUF1080 domain-containing protein [Actinomycetota bacterium]|nr:DUF1080 domain-containing protein [Actinomycetota bacterium]
MGTSAGQQDYTRQPVQASLVWNRYEFHVAGDDYTVRLNGSQTTSFTNDDPARGRARSNDPLSGFIGLQSHPRPGAVAFRHIQVKPLG